MKLLVGLGNPGPRYRGTYHNVGFEVVDEIARRHGARFGGSPAEALTARVRGLADDLWLVKPLTYMNVSGVAVRKVLARERAPLAELLVVTDDFSLPFGKMRFRESGSAGGHNGLASIVEEMGTEKFNRLRIGIGDPSRGAVDHVLGRFEPSERARLDELLDLALVSDLGLLDGSGHDVVRRFRERHAGPAIAVSGYGAAADVAASLAAGFDAHLVKPVDPGRIVALLGARRAPAADPGTPIAATWSKTR